VHRSRKLSFIVGLRKTCECGPLVVARRHGISRFAAAALSLARHALDLIQLAGTIMQTRTRTSA
jgi:hypothetical protein